MWGSKCHLESGYEAAIARRHHRRNTATENTPPPHATRPCTASSRQLPTHLFLSPHLSPVDVPHLHRNIACIRFHARPAARTAAVALSMSVDVHEHEYPEQ